MANWDLIRNYQRSGWKPQAADMDCINVASVGGQSGFDAGFGNHNLTATVTDINGVVWTATSAGDPILGLSGTLTASSGEAAYLLVEAPEAGVPASDQNL